MWLHLTAMFSLGMASALHCMAMCGLPAMVAVNASRGSGGIALYHSARITSYMILGLISIALGTALGKLSALWHHQQAFTLAIVLVIFCATLLKPVQRFLERKFTTPLRPVLAKLTRSSQTLASVSPYLKTWFTGMVHGLIPCGMVYSAMVLGAATYSPMQTIAGMVVFGMATSLNLSVWQLLGQRFQFTQRLSTLKPVLIGISLLLMLRSLQEIHIHTSPDHQKPGMSKECR